MQKTTHLLPDLPVENDEFGPHKKLALELEQLVRARAADSYVPHSIALLGDWGSGKSSVVRMLRAALQDNDSDGGSKVETFLYDAWAHEGDGLRRAFLDSMRTRFDTLLNEAQREAIRKDIWDKHESTTTTKQAILRRHGKILIFSLLVVPPGLRLFGAYPGGWPEAFEAWWNTLALGAVFAPLIVATLLYYLKEMLPLSASKWLFGAESQKELDDIKISSIFLQKTEGEVQHYWKTDAADSIHQFRTAFLKLCELVLGHDKRLLVVVDNLDRLDKEEARAFWATMQSFFDRTGWQHNGVADRVWLLVPFSPLAIEKVFAPNASDSARSEYQSFIDKSFDLSLIVPPPIQVDSRRFLLAHLKLAFPEHDGQTLEKVRNLFDRHRSEGHTVGRAGDARATRKTPREMKLFINQLVALSRVQSGEIPLEIQAAYLLVREKIAQDGFAPHDQLSNYQRSLLPRTPDLVQQLAAVHFGVDLDVAAQVILSAPIRAAVEDGELEQLQLLSSQSGFVDVLENIITDVGSATAASIFAKARMLSRLEIADDLTMKSTWSALAGELLGVDRIGEVGDAELEGFGALHDRLSFDQQGILFETLRSGLETRWVGDVATRPRQDTESFEIFDRRVANATSWARLQRRFHEIAGSRYRIVALPISAWFTVRVLDELSSAPGALAQGLEPRSDANLTIDAIVNWPGTDDGPRNPVDFVRTIVSLNWKLPWNDLAKFVLARLGDQRPDPTQNMVLLLSIAAAAQSTVAKAGISEAAISGTLNAAVVSAGSGDEAKAAALALIIMFAPTTAPVGFDARGRQIESVITPTLSAVEASDPVITGASEYIRRTYMGRVALSNISANPMLFAVGSRIIERITDENYSFFPSRDQLLLWAPFLAEYLPAEKADKLLRNMGGIDDLVTNFAKAPVEESAELPIYWLLRTQIGLASRPLRTHLQRYLKNLSGDEWRRAISAPNSVKLKIAEKIKSGGYRVSVGVSLSDAIIETLRTESLAENIRHIAPNISMAVPLLPDNIRKNMSAKLWEVANSTNDTDRIKAIIDIAGDYMIDMSTSNSTDILNNSFKRIISSPTTQYINWIEKVIRSNRDEFISPSPATSEFRARINEKLRVTSGVEGDIKRALRKVKDLLPRELKIRG
ncbi:P-loop NTPase fold protein [Devosia sp.]|uniref:P-loop NTPase fold protein n=1 Tax=Devosia sp. TaxID=1871048 RepID=UPI001B28AE03|nr:P-loop NTPase fold protein [Devosia sp.]MBO9590397.1 hypothetical protein [Devosia sp.]